MSCADSLGARPNTKLKGDSLSSVKDGVMFMAKEISVKRDDHCGAESLVERIFNSEVSVLCCDSHRPFVLG